jgi:hypothetical protein
MSETFFLGLMPGELMEFDFYRACDSSGWDSVELIAWVSLMIGWLSFCDPVILR